jgi:transposase InsO family protein
MNSPGSPYNNACAESFFRSLKVECLDAAHFATRRQAAEEITEYMLFYNRRTTLSPVRRIAARS